MKDPENSLDQLFEAARQQPPAVSVQELRSLLGAVPLPPTDPGAASAGSGTTGGAGAVAGKTTTALLTTKSLAMLTSIVSTALIGTALWVQDAPVKQHSTTATHHQQNKPVGVQVSPTWLEPAAAVAQREDTTAATAANGKKPKKAKKAKAAEASAAAPAAEPASAEQPTVWEQITEAPFIWSTGSQQVEWKKDEKTGQYSYSTQSGQSFDWSFDFNREGTPASEGVRGQAGTPGTTRVAGRAAVPATTRVPLEPGRPAVAPTAARAAVVQREPEPARAPLGPRAPEGVRKTPPVRKPEHARARPAAPLRKPEPLRDPNEKNWPQGATVTVTTSNPEPLTAKAIDEARYVRLQPKELEELGIQLSEKELRYRNIINQTAPLPGEAGNSVVQVKDGNGSKLLGTMLDLAFTGKDNIHVDAHRALTDKATDIYPVFISEGANVQRIQYKLRHEPNHKMDKGFFDEIEQTLVPVLVESKHGLEGKVVFWFSLTPAFLQTLPAEQQKKLESQYAKVLEAQAEAEKSKAFRAEVDKEEEAQLKSLEKRYSGLRSVESGEVYPNPARENVSLRMEFKQAEKIHVSLLDVKGRLVSQLLPDQDVEAGTFSRQLKLDELAPGLYLLVIESAKGGRWSQRLVVE